jgi:glutamine phosphoribosylpyrophosphate amidotransferase
MCGLFGVIGAPGRNLVAHDARRFVALGKLGQRRGSDASGIVTLEAGGIRVVKSDLPFATLTRTGEARALGRVRAQPARDARVLGVEREQPAGDRG